MDLEIACQLLHWCTFSPGYGILSLFFIYSQPIKCGQTIRLTHVTTDKNLHSHHFQSPLSHNLEVSAFGDEGEGDEGECGWKYFLQ